MQIGRKRPDSGRFPLNQSEGFFLPEVQIVPGGVEPLRRARRAQAGPGPRM